MNPFDMLRNAQAIQQKMAEMQAKLDAMVVEGSAGGGMVSVSMNGKFETLSVRIDPECCRSQEDIPLLQDLVRAAMNDAIAAIRDRITAELGTLGLPGGMPGLA